jgi:flagellar biogenesis protein FliO
MHADVIENKDMGVVVACVFLTLIIVILLMLIGIALVLRFKDHSIIKKMISFPNQLTMSFT